MGTRTSLARLVVAVWGAAAVLVIGIIGTAALASIGGADAPAVPANRDPAGTGLAATESATGDAVSQLAISTDVQGLAKGAQISALASGGISRAGQHAASPRVESAAAPIPTPNEGGTGTANLASDGVSVVGTATADEQSQGHSAAGSGNAAH